MAENPANSAEKSVRRPGSVALWAREARLPFMTGAVVPVLVGSAVAWYERSLFSLPLLLLTVVGAMLAQAGANMANDYYDWASGNDNINPYRSPFNGGAGVIQEGWLTPRQVHVAAFVSLGLAAAIGVVLWRLTVPGVVWLALAGGIAAYFYTADPLHLAYYGLGELLVGMSFGPLLVAGTYMVQTGTMSLAAVLASMPVGLLIAAVLYINQFPDYQADKAVGKAHWVVRLGTERALPGLAGLLFGTHFFLVFAVLTGLAPWPTLAGLLTLPLALKAFSLARLHHSSPVQLRPANAMVIGTHLLTGLLLAGGFLAGALWGV